MDREEVLGKIQEITADRLGVDEGDVTSEACFREDVEGDSLDLVERRLVYAMLNEAAMACAEGVVRSSRDGDIGAIYGIGFPAFRGGPLRMIDDIGASKVVSTLHELEDQYGERFRPAPALVEMAREGGRYYPA